MAKHRVSKGRRQRTRGAKRRSTGPVAGLAAAGVALTGALALGAAPTLTASPQLLAALHYLRGTNIGFVPSQQQYEDFIGTVIDGTGVTPPSSYEEVPYNGGFRPFSHGGFGDLTYDGSVAQGVQLLGEQNIADGDVVFGFSQGAVAASLYKATHTGNTYVLVANPSRPNGGVMQRFKGWKIPFVDVTFSGATPATGDYTIDVVRQYDGWADFPTYLWNPIAVANAVMGIVLVHGNTQLELTTEDLEQAEQAGSDYYQFDEDSNTAYYVIRTYPVPLLMPLNWLPDPILAALDAPLRWFIETAYDRTDYSQPLRSQFFAPLNLFSQDVASAAALAEEPADQEPAGDDPGDAAAARAAGSAAAGDVTTAELDEEPAGEAAPSGVDGGADDEALDAELGAETESAAIELADDGDEPADDEEQAEPELVEDLDEAEVKDEVKDEKADDGAGAEAPAADTSTDDSGDGAGDASAAA